MGLFNWLELLLLTRMGENHYLFISNNDNYKLGKITNNNNKALTTALTCYNQSYTDIPDENKEQK